MITLNNILIRYKIITHMRIFCDPSVAAIEQALIDLECTTGDFIFYCHKCYYLESIRCIAELMCFIDLQGSASDHVVICNDLGKDAWVCGHKDKAIFSGGA